MTPPPHSPARTRATSLSRLAKHLGLSPTTVSFVLNGQAEVYKIAPETTRRVLDAAREMDYVPNALARGLRQKRTHTIGVVFPHLRADWAHRIMQGVVQGLGDREPKTVPLMVCHHGSGALERKLLQALVERRVDGIICNPLADGRERYRQVQQRGVPLVFLSDAPRGLDEISSVAWDQAVVGVAVRHLVELGHRRIAYLGVRDNRKVSSASRRVFRDALRSAGLPCRRQDVVLISPDEAFDEPVRRMLGRKDRPTAFFALYDDIAISVLDLVEREGWRCPEDLSIATIGGSPLTSAPGYHITTVVGSIPDEGRACVECLLELIEHPGRGPIHRLVSGGRLVLGRTTGPAPGT